MRNFVFRHKIVTGMMLLDVIVVVVFFVMLIVRFRENALIQVLVAPSFARVTINGKEYKSGDAYKVKPGELEIVVTGDGLETKIFNVMASPNNTTKVYAYLTGVGGDFSVYESSVTELESLERVGQDEPAREFLRKMSIIKVLPYHYSVFNDDTMEYTKFTVDIDRIDCPEKFCMQAVNEGNSTVDLMKQKMKEKGYNLDDYEVYYF